MSSVKVALRIRPRNTKEILDNNSECIIYDPDVNEKQITLLPNRTFEFDYVFNVDSTQSMVYECVKPLLDKFLEGFNSTVFAYGQTSSGKTYTMGIGLDGNLNTEMQGIVPRSIYDLFQRLEEKDSDKFKYRVFVTFLELYNEDLTDLLHPESSNNYQIREDPWLGIKEEEVESPEELLRFLQNGSLCRKTDTTQMNENSSRSHAIFTITLKQEKWVEKDQESTTNDNDNKIVTDENNKKPDQNDSSDNKDENNKTDIKSESKGEWVKLSSKFRFVDLAGSERLKRTQAIGEQVKEGIKINQGLFALGKVIRALSEQRERHIPYRESKLTRLLKNSLGGNSQTLMLACVSCCEIDFNESLSTLRYAQSARKIKNKAIINTDWGHSAKDIAIMKKKLGELQQTVNRLRDELSWYKGNGSVKSVRTDNEEDDHVNKSIFSSSTYSNLQNEISELKNESENQKDELDELHFTVSQLQDRIKDLTQQLAKAEAERDSMAIEFYKDKQQTQQTEIPVTEKEITESKSKFNIKTEPDDKNSEEKENIDDSNIMEKVTSNPNNETVNEKNKEKNTNDKENVNGEDEDDDDEPYVIKQNPIVVNYLKTISELNEKCRKAEDQLKYYKAIHEENNGNKKIIRHRPFYEASRVTSISDKIQNEEETINDIKVDELIKRESDKQIKKDNNSTLISTAHINNRYIEKINRLKNEVSQLKKKYGEATMSISSTKNQNSNQIKTMKSNIESLKAEKVKMMKKIREERERANSKILEIKKLKKKEYEASQLVKKLEQNNQLQQILLKRRKDEMKNCQRKMKSMMDYLNRSNIPKTISKSPRRKRPKLPLKQSEKDKEEMLINSIDLNEDSRLKKKKQMLDHELDQCIIVQEIQHMIDEMEKKKTRLLDEQRELKNEREKIIRIETAKSKSYDPDQPQYMDDRLEMIDAELQLINSRIIEAKKNNTLTDGVKGDENGFTNALNIIKTTSFDNLQKLTEMLLNDIVEMKLKERHQMAQAASNERTIADLRVTLQVMKKTAVSAAIEYERKVKDLRHQQAYRQDQSNKTLSEYEDNYSDVTGGEMDDEEDGDISTILNKEKSIVENDNDDNWLGRGEIYNKIYETGVIQGGRAEAVVNAAASNHNATEDNDLSNNEASLDYISSSYTPGLPSEIYQNISAYRNEDGKDDNGEGEYLNDDDMSLPVTPINKRIEDNTYFVKPGSTGGKSDDSVFLSPNTENTIINTIINSGTLVNTSTPYQFSNGKELDINTPLKNKGIQPLSPIEFSKENSDNSPLDNTLTLSMANNLSNNYPLPNENTNEKNDTNTNNDTNINVKIKNENNVLNDQKGNPTSYHNDTTDNHNHNNKNDEQLLSPPPKNSSSPTTPNRVGSNSSTSSIPIASSKKTKKFEFKKPDEINKSKKLISPPKSGKVKSPVAATSKSNKTPSKNEDGKKSKTKIEEKSPAKKSSFMSTLKNSTHFLTSLANPFTSPKKSPIKKPSFLFLQSLKIGGGDKNTDHEEDKKDKESETLSTAKTPKRKNDDREEKDENDKFISPPPSKRVKKDATSHSDKSKKENKDTPSNKNEHQVEGSTPKSKHSSPEFKSPLSTNTLSDIVKSVHEESIQKLQNEMMNRSMLNEKHTTNSSFSQDGDTSSGDISRLAYIHTQASQAKINTKSTTTDTSS